MAQQSQPQTEHPADVVSKPAKATRKRKQPPAAAATSAAIASGHSADAVSQSQAQSEQTEGDEGGGDLILELAAIIEQEARNRHVS